MKSMNDSLRQEIILGGSSKDIVQVEFVGKCEYLLADLLPFLRVKVLELSMVLVPELSERQVSTMVHTTGARIHTCSDWHLGIAA
jgi:hypothetical protein